MRWKLLVLYLVISIQLDEVSPCPPGVIPGLEASVQFLGTVSTAVGERKEDSEGNPLPITASIAFFKGLSKLASLAGGVLGLAGFILDQFQESDFSKIKREFGKVNQGIADLKFRFDDLQKIVEKENAWTRMHPNLQFLDTVSTTLDSALNAKHLETRNEFKEMLLAYYKQGDILKSLNGIYYDVVGNSMYISTVDILYQQTKGDWSAINIMSQYISGLLVQGHLAFTSACVLHKVKEEGFEAEDARQQCVVISEDYFKTKEPLYEQKFEDVLYKCRTGEMKNNLQMDIEEIVRNARDREVTPNRVVGDRIVDLIRNKYFWLDASVMVYDDIQGYERQTMICSLHNFRDYGRNWCVMLQDKPEYRDQFTGKEELLSADINYFPSVVSHTEFANVQPTIDERTAEQVFDTIWEQLKHLGIYSFELAVIRYLGPGMWTTEKYNVHTTTTNKEQFLINYYDICFENDVISFIVMFSFKWEYVSFAMECPPDYPYIFHFGQFCTKSHRTWFTKTYLSNDGYVSCPVNLCRTRTGGRLDQNKHPTVWTAVIDDSLFTERIQNFMMYWSLETTLMLTLLTMMLVLLIRSYFFK